MPDIYQMKTDEDFANFYAEEKENFLREAAYREHRFVSTQRLSEEDREKQIQITQMLSFLPKGQLKKMADHELRGQIKDGKIVEQKPDGKVKIGNVEVDVFDLDFMIAESLQRLYSSEDPKAEYFDWIVAQEKIESDINTDGTTEEEVVARNHFIGFLDDRETEMKRVMALYAGAAMHGQGYYKEQAQEKLDFMKFKLSELRRLRTKTMQTRDKSDEQERAERDAINRGTKMVIGMGVAEMALTGAAVQQDLTRGERFILNKSGSDANQFENDMAHHIIEMRPETHTREEAEDRVATMKRNKFGMKKMLMAMRMGKSKEDVLEEEMEAETRIYELQPKAREYSGFVIDRFRNLRTRESA